MRKIYKRMKDIDEENDILDFGIALTISLIFSIFVFFFAK